MRRFVCGILVAMLGIVLSAPSVAAQTATGPEVRQKVAVASSGSFTLGAGDAWLSWGEDELVARTIHAPVKLMGLRGATPAARQALKPLTGRTEAQVRAALAARSAGDVDSGAARRWIEEAIREYRGAVEELLALR